jgi:hypothetical protein
MASAAPEKSIVVLPFQNLTKGAGECFLCRWACRTKSLIVTSLEPEIAERSLFSFHIFLGGFSETR